MAIIGNVFLVGALIAMTAAEVACGQTHPQWIDLTDSSGLHVKAPAGWTVVSSNGSLVQIKNSDGSLFVMLKPFKSGAEATAANSLESLVKQWPKILPNARVSQLKQISDAPDQAIAKVQFGPQGGSRANVLCYRQNGVGMFYAIAAPADRFEASRSTLVDVLSSFRYGAAPPSAAGGAEASGLTYTSWTEPNERAFTVQVPEGWNVAGGITRSSPIDLRTEITASSPDGQIQAQYGDAKMLRFTPLTGTVFARGFHQGSVSEYHGWFMFLDYETGAQFSKGYLNLVLSKKYTGLQIGESKDRPDIQQLIEACFAKSPIPFRISAGQTEFTYSDNGQTKSGVCFVTTIFTAPGTASQGWIAIPAICTAPPDKMKVALEVLGHLAVPKYSPEWIASVNGAAAKFTTVIQATAQNDRAMSDRIYQNFTNQMAESDRPLQNLLTGTVDVRDANGTAYHVAAGHNYYYLSGGMVAGSNSATPPDVGFVPLTQF